MKKGLLARKLGMTRMILPETGEMVAVTVCEVTENTVLQSKTQAKDGYSSTVIGAFPRNKKCKNVNQRYKHIQEVRLDEDDVMEPGKKLTLADFEGVDAVKVTGTSKGRGFSGVIKRHKFARGPETHGSEHHRQPGSVGMCAKPGRILRGKKMPGQHGNVRTTLRSVSVLDIDPAKGVIVLKGAIPGPTNSYLFLRAS